MHKEYMCMYFVNSFSLKGIITLLHTVIRKTIDNSDYYVIKDTGIRYMVDMIESKEMII